MTRPRVMAAAVVLVLATLVLAALALSGRDVGEFPDEPAKEREDLELLSTDSRPVPMVVELRR